MGRRSKGLIGRKGIRERAAIRSPSFYLTTAEPICISARNIHSPAYKMGEYPVLLAGVNLQRKPQGSCQSKVGIGRSASRNLVHPRGLQVASPGVCGQATATTVPYNYDPSFQCLGQFPCKAESRNAPEE